MHSNASSKAPVKRHQEQLLAGANGPTDPREPCETQLLLIRVGSAAPNVLESLETSVCVVEYDDTSATLASLISRSAKQHTRGRGFARAAVDAPSALSALVEPPEPEDTSAGQARCKRILQALGKAVRAGGHCDIFGWPAAVEHPKAFFAELAAATNTRFGASVGALPLSSVAPHEWAVDSDHGRSLEATYLRASARSPLHTKYDVAEDLLGTGGFAVVRRATLRAPALPPSNSAASMASAASGPSRPHSTSPAPLPARAIKLLDKRYGESEFIRREARMLHDATAALDGGGGDQRGDSSDSSSTSAASPAQRGNIGRIRLDASATRNHNIVRFFEMFETPRYAALVIELVGSGRTLADRLADRYAEAMAWEAMEDAESSDGGGDGGGRGEGGRGGEGGGAEFGSVGFGLPELEAAGVMLALCSALQHLHDRCGIAHRDVKPSNLLYPALEQAGAGSRGGGAAAEAASASRLKLSDFSLARRLEPSAADESESSGGTPAYAAPEVLANGGEFSGAAATAKVDVWAAGVLLFETLCGETPFGDTCCEALLPKLYRRIQTCPVEMSSPRWQNVSETARSLVHRLLDRNVASRPCVADVLDDAFVLSARRAADAFASADAGRGVSAADGGAHAALNHAGHAALNHAGHAALGAGSAAEGTDDRRQGQAPRGSLTGSLRAPYPMRALSSPFRVLASPFRATPSLVTPGRGSSSSAEDRVEVPAGSSSSSTSHSQPPSTATAAADAPAASPAAAVSAPAAVSATAAVSTAVSPPLPPFEALAGTPRRSRELPKLRASPSEAPSPLSGGAAASPSSPPWQGATRAPLKPVPIARNNSADLGSGSCNGSFRSAAPLPPIASASPLLPPIGSLAPLPPSVGL